MFRIFKIYSLLISFTLIFNCNADIKEEINSNVTKTQSDFIEVYRPELNYLPSNDKLKKIGWNINVTFENGIKHLIEEKKRINLNKKIIE